MTEPKLAPQRAVPDNKTCFVVMPFGRNADEERWFNGWYTAVMDPAIRSAGYEPVLSAAEDQPSAINDEIRAHLVFDAMVVVDLGGRNPEDPPNPNVMYELGIRHAFGLPVVLLAWDGQRLPFDVSNQRAILSRRDFLDIEPTRSRLARFIHAAGQGKFYNPMEAVGREAAIDKTSLVLGEESLLAALAGEVRSLRVALAAGRSPTPPRWTKPRKVRPALNKQCRSQLWAHAQGIGYDETRWSKFLSTALSDERYEAMTKWTIDDWISYATERAGEFSVEPLISAPPRISQETIDAVRVELPSQPWPRGVHKLVAGRLNLSSNEVSRAIQQLIHEGVFSHQLYGVVLSETNEPSVDEQGIE